MHIIIYAYECACVFYLIYVIVPAGERVVPTVEEQSISLKERAGVR